MRQGLVIALICAGLLASCDRVFSLDRPDGGEADGDDDAPLARPFPHLPPDTLIGDAELFWDGQFLIDTSALAIVPPQDGVSLEAIPQFPAGPELAVLRVRTIVIASRLKVVGSRPLVIIANRISIPSTGSVDASADQESAGPGTRPVTSPGTGRSGQAAAPSVSGAGGGGFATGAGKGGDAGLIAACTSVATGGPAGLEVGDPEVTILEGGARGGGGQTCATLGGGGGGALQLSALTMIRVEGTIDVGGGGGPGGGICPATTPTMADGGSGGGAGGAIYLDAATVEVKGTIAASGGGGGGGGWASGACTGTPPRAGGAGSDGGLASTAAAGGLPAVSGCGREGGIGAVNTAPAINGGAVDCNGYAGGGGGAVGRIVLRGAVNTPGTVIPPATLLPL